ncbi:unnamed protein product [Caenorhabditis bovis]|uniref:C2H2-type domain-containing protein n=1 Tax=Caenorhabditis bovis TaxID=2654633 RepID=A0A8S1EY08_9PELO|nr:unnamed protein product [Caenorhabditis bovis]
MFPPDVTAPRLIGIFPVHERAYAECRKENGKAKKFACPFVECGKSFATRGGVADHLNERHTGERPYRCETCRQDFAARARFAVHLKKYHQMSIKSYNFVGQQLNIARFQ